MFPLAVDRPQIAATAVGRASSQLKADFPDSISSVFHHGSVDVDARELIVWVLLKGNKSAIPRWCFDPDDPRNGFLETGFVGRLKTMQAVVRSHLARANWPSPESVAVGFESADRVAADGGWHHFK